MKIVLSNMTKLLAAIALVLTGILSSHYVVADDTDILANNKSLPPANVLMIFDSSGSMKWSLSGDKKPVGTEKSRMETLRTALGKALDAIDANPEIPDINLGMMNFSGHKGKWLAHGPAYPVASIKEKAGIVLNSNPLFTHPGTPPLVSYMPVPSATETGKDYLKKIAATWKPKNNTPIVDALYEAALYMKGKPVHWGKKPPNNKRSAHPSTYTGLISVNGTSSTKNVCKYKACGGNTGVACNATMRNCSTSTQATHHCYLGSEAACLAANPSYTSCTAKSWQSCKNTCPGGQYDEAGNCLNPVTACTTKNYFKCVEPVNTTTCEHEICKNVTTVDNTVTGNATYNSPINEECQSSHIVLLSDGAPTVNNSSSDVASFIGPTYANNCDAGSDFARCGKELAKYLANTDHRPNLMGDHRIKVHTIGLALSSGSADAIKAIKNLKELASPAYGDGSYNTADTPEELAKVLENIGKLGIDKAHSFSAPTYSPDPGSLLSNGDEVYLPMFNSDASSVWTGNLKKFKLSNGKLVDGSNQPATDSQGNLVKNIKDIWSLSTGPTEHPVTGGGVANLLDPAQRKLFSDQGTLNSSYALLKAKLGNASMTNAHRDELLNFIRGKRLDGKNRYHMGDIIHSKPVLASYNGNGVVFIGTNEGFLHAFDSASGKEIFAFMPDELLKNIEPQFDAVENSAKSKHLYGVDGQITLWHSDTNHNGKIDGSEKAILYFGLRRGGKSYYALDVSNPALPSLLWKKTVNAHSWSKPVVAKLKYKPNPKAKPVVIFGGGYSDDASGKEIVGKGNAVYIVDALTGATVWNTTVTHALASPIRVIDLDQNGTADRLYFADTGGNIGRVDLNAGAEDTPPHPNDLSHAKVTKVASLGTAHKFFVEPDVAVFKYKGQNVLSIAIGSGERPNPLDTTNNDYFFVIFDENVYSLPTASTGTIDITQLAVAPAISVDMISPSRTKKGWKMKLAAPGIKGEKVLSSALTFHNMVMFTSFGIGDTTLTPKNCSQKTSNISSLYVLDLLTGGTTLDLNGDGVIDDKDKPIPVGEGITDTPQIIFPKGTCTTSHCERPFEIRVGTAVKSVATNKTASNQPKNTKIPRVYWLDQK